MKDTFQTPNFGMATGEVTSATINALARKIEQTFRDLAARGRADCTTINYQPLTVATLPTRAREGDVSYASNGRKNGEGVGAGTGVLVFFDGSNWIACDSGQTVAA